MLIRQNRGGADTACENAPPLPPLVCVLDDDPDIRGSIESLLRSEGFSVQTYASTSEFVMCESVDRAACLLLDINLGDANGLDFQEELAGNEIAVPVILMSGYGDIPMTVRGMRAGALDFLAKPLSDDVLLAAVSDAIRKDEVRRAASAALDGTRQRYNALTNREREIMGLVTAGLMNKQIAARLGLSEITVKIHRGNMTRKMQADSLADLVRMAEELGAREASASRFNR
ncbi:FixJ family two-component response regulator [Sphingopyxis sp. OAS728]|uniref:response regulator transcription factor n=1 Tax=Sphingopyxis sp. OAS728 TaxID=2663823 RepID=UPI0017893E06|nr:response regulator [Sphingopyxis sp. OAS728]MBE1529001.1 FixJ family two-component response regulator [Sphingopyxis sp. OAS728]